MYNTTRRLTYRLLLLEFSDLLGRRLELCVPLLELGLCLGKLLPRLHVRLRRERELGLGLVVSGGHALDLVLGLAELLLEFGRSSAGGGEVLLDILRPAKKRSKETIVSTGLVHARVQGSRNRPSRRSREGLCLGVHVALESNEQLVLVRER